MSYSGASVDAIRGSSEFGSGRSGWGVKGNIIRDGIPLTNNAVDAVIALPASQASGYTATIQINNYDGTPISHAQRFMLYVLLDKVPTGLATTGGSTGIAIGSNGFISKTTTTKLIFECFTDAAGKFTATWTDTAHEVAYLGVLLPTGRMVISGPLTTS